MADPKYYNWECVVWKKSLVDIQRIYDFGVKGFISPLHALDGGEPHYHVIWCFDRGKTYKALMADIEAEGLSDCINTVRYVKDLTSRARYLCHLDEPHKVHYDPADVQTMGGMNYSKYLDYTTDSVDMDLNIFQVIDKYKCVSYSQLVRYCAYVDKEKYKNVVGRCGFWSAYMRSLASDSRSMEMEYVINERRGIKNGSDL